MSICSALTKNTWSGWIGRRQIPQFKHADLMGNTDAPSQACKQSGSLRVPEERTAAAKPRNAWRTAWLHRPLPDESDTLVPPRRLKVYAGKELERSAEAAMGYYHGTTSGDLTRGGEILKTEFEI